MEMYRGECEACPIHIATNGEKCGYVVIRMWLMLYLPFFMMYQQVTDVGLFSSRFFNEEKEYLLYDSPLTDHLIEELGRRGYGGNING